MRATEEEIAQMEQAYRRAKFVIIGQACFLAAGCFLAILIRRNLKLAPIFLFSALVAALLLFGKDIFKLFYCRNELRRLRGDDTSS
ncbi:MAG: hypothetical protein EXS38_04910 [Opitutus sp.]|nr:hypothetical protein [Opitutus sp.]